MCVRARRLAPQWDAERTSARAHHRDRRPSGAGKGTIARAVAARLNYRHVDTGAMYRAVGWKALQQGLDMHDEAAVAAIAERARFELEPGRVLIDGMT